MTRPTNDPVLDELVAAAQVVVDNKRWGATCYGPLGARGHPLGSNRTCAYCQLHNALTAFAASQAEQ